MLDNAPIGYRSFKTAVLAIILKCTLSVVYGAQ